MKQTGITENGDKVIGDAFILIGTHGTPLEHVLSYLKENNMVMDWVDYIKSALSDGHKLSTIKSRIMTAVGDVYGGDYANQVKKRLDMI